MQDAQFYEYVAMRLQESGHMITSSPVYFNHSANEALYMDSFKDVIVSLSERNTLSLIENVSLLVELTWPGAVEELTERVHIYSITVNFSDQSRSQNIADLHRLLHEYWTCNHSIVFFKNRDSYAISFADKDCSCILSDWFPINIDYDDVVDRIDIGNISMESSDEYFTDFIYAAAREYYIHPISFEDASYGMMPLHYLVPRADTDITVSKEDIKDLIRENMRYFEYIYGDDYVDPIYEGQSTRQQYHNLSDEIDRISFELELSADLDEDDQGEMFDFDMDADDEEFDDDFFDEDDDDIDPAIFDDPVLMVKWLEKKQKSQGAELDTTTPTVKRQSPSRDTTQHKKHEDLELPTREVRAVTYSHEESECDRRRNLAAKKRIEADYKRATAERKRLEAEQRRATANQKNQYLFELQQSANARQDVENKKLAAVQKRAIADQKHADALTKRNDAKQKRIKAEELSIQLQKLEQLEAERREQERLEAERREQARLEAERREQERLEAERREQERLEAERREQERLEAERREQERLEAERREQERLEALRRQAKALEDEHIQILSRISNQYAADLAPAKTQLSTVLQRLKEIEDILPSLSFIQFMEKKKLTAEKDTLMAKRDQLLSLVNSIESHFNEMTAEEHRRYESAK